MAGRNGGGAEKNLQVLLLGEGNGGKSAVETIVRAELKACDCQDGVGCSFVSAVEADNGHEVVRSLLVGAYCVNAAVLLINAFGAGSLEINLAEDGRTRELILLLTALGVRHFAVLVQGLDRCSVAEQRYDHVQSQCQELLDSSGFEPASVPFVPAVVPTSVDTNAAASRLQNEHSAQPSISNKQGAMPVWYQGPTLMEVLRKAAAAPAPELAQRSLRMSVRDVYKVHGAEIVAVCGIESGTLREGAAFAVSPGPPTQLEVRRIEKDGKEASLAEPGDVVQLVGVHEVPSAGLGSGVARIHVGSVVSEFRRDPVQVCQRFLALLVVLSKPDGVTITAGYEPILDAHAAHVPCRVAQLLWCRRLRGLETGPSALIVGDVAEAWLEPLEPICLEVFSVSPPLGRFGLRDRGVMFAAGVVRRLGLVEAPHACFED